MALARLDNMMAASVEKLVIIATNRIERIEKWLAFGAPHNGAQGFAGATSKLASAVRARSS